MYLEYLFISHVDKKYEKLRALSNLQVIKKLHVRIVLINYKFSFERSTTQTENLSFWTVCEKQQLNEPLINSIAL